MCLARFADIKECSGVLWIQRTLGSEWLNTDPHQVGEGDVSETETVSEHPYFCPTGICFLFIL